MLFHRLATNFLSGGCLMAFLYDSIRLHVKSNNWFLVLHHQFKRMKNIASDLLKRCHQICQIEKKKYQTKGPLNTVIAYVLLVSILYFGRLIGLYLWPKSIENKVLFYFIAVLSLALGSQLLSFLIFLPGYLSISSFYEKFKINRRSNWPWERENWKETAKKTILNFILNELILSPLFLFGSTVSGIKYRFTDFPTFGEIVTQLAVVYFVEDTIFYWVHRILHTYPKLYPIHKVHHEYDHVYVFATSYMHPVDYMLGSFLPSAIGFTLLGKNVHCFTPLFWILCKVLLGTEAHSGYEFPWSPMRVVPLVSGPSFHDHHHSSNVGNYAGSCYLWDVMLGTSDHYWKQFLAVKQ